MKYATIGLMLVTTGLVVASATATDAFPGVAGFSIRLLDASVADLRRLALPVANQFEFQRTGIDREDEDTPHNRVSVAEFRQFDAVFLLARYKVPGDCVDVESYGWGSPQVRKAKAVVEEFRKAVSEQLADRVQLFDQPKCGHAL